MSSDKSTNRLYIEKLGASDSKKFVGDAGEIFYDPTEGDLRLSDGKTEGGIPATESIVEGLGFIPEDSSLFKSVGLNTNTEYGNVYADYAVLDGNEIVVGEGAEVIFDRFNSLDDVNIKSIETSGLNVDGVSNLGFLQKTQKVVGNISLENNTDYYSFSEELIVDPYIEITVVSGSTVTLNKLSLIEGTGGGGGTSSQWVTTSAGIYTGSNVGIGTTNPKANLQVEGDLIVSAGVDTSKYISIKAYEDNGGSLSFEGTEGQLFSITNNLSSGSIFNVNDIDGNPIIDANANGKLGIGTTNPTEKLTVVGDARVTGILTVGTASITLDGNNNTIGIGTGVSIDGNFGAVFATTFVGDGTGLVGIVTDAVGTEIYENGDARGTATQINFGNGFNVDPVTSSCANVNIGLDGSNNFIVGGGSGGSYNNFLGFCAGYCNTTGGANNFFGNAAGLNNTTGFYNNFFGIAAGRDTTIGYNNTYLGSWSGISTSTSNKIIFGSGTPSNFFDCPDTNKDTQFAVGIRTDSNPANYWLVGNENFNIGIGTTDPTEKLTVGGNVSVSGVVTATSFYGDGSHLTGISGGGSSQWVSTSAGIYTGSNVGIGTTNPLEALHVSSNSIIGGTLAIGRTDVSSSGSNAKVHILGNLKLGYFSSLVWDGFYPSYVGGLSGPGGYVNFNAGNNGNTIYIRDISNNSNAIYSSNDTRLDLGTSTNKIRNIWLGGVQIIGSATSTGTSNQAFQVGTATTQLGVYISGNLGIGTTNPVDKLTVQNGNIRVGVNTSNGLILTDANGVSWKLIVNTDGSLSTVSV